MDLIKHLKRGSVYDVIAREASFQVSGTPASTIAGITLSPKSRVVNDGDKVTVYQSEHGTFVRFPDEMGPDRFEPVAMPPAAGPRTYSATITLTAKKIADQITTAVEGGITYWASGFFLKSHDQSAFARPWYDDPKLYEQDFSITVVQHEEHTAGAGTDVVLTPELIQRGLTVMATKYGRHFSDMVEENGDATTADVFIQCCVFGDLIYG